MSEAVNRDNAGGAERLQRNDALPCDYISDVVVQVQTDLLTKLDDLLPMNRRSAGEQVGAISG